MGKTTDIREAVEAELAFDPLVDAGDTTVVNMNGDVGLNGTVPRYPQYLEASAAAQRVAGVKNVHNHLEVMLPPGDYRDGLTGVVWAPPTAAAHGGGPGRASLTGHPGRPRRSGPAGPGSQVPAGRPAGRGDAETHHDLQDTACRHEPAGGWPET